MRKMQVLVVVATSLAMLVGATSALAAAAADGSGHRATIIRLTTVEAQSQEIDLPPEGTFSLGDRFVFSDDLFRHGEKVGFDGGECLLVRQDPAHDDVAATVSFNCVVTLSLPSGMLTLQTLFTTSADQEAAGGEPEAEEVPLVITGGSGRYRNARGDGTLVEDANQGTLRLRVIH